MIQRRGKPSFSKDDEERLLAYMDVTRSLTINYAAAYGYHSPQYALKTSLTVAIDKLAEQITGDPQFFWANPILSANAGAMPTSSPPMTAPTAEPMPMGRIKLIIRARSLKKPDAA